MFYHFVIWLTDTVDQLGYPGIVMRITPKPVFFPIVDNGMVPTDCCHEGEQ